MIVVSDIEKYYGSYLALKIHELKIKPGEIFGLVGNNGAGKTTMLRLALDLIRANKGSVYSGDYNVAKSEDWKDYTASYLDEGFLIDFLTPEEFFYFIGDTSGLSKDQTEKKLDEYSNFFNGEVLGKGKKFIRDFSMGNKQKIGIISALITNPRVLILDEPFNHLDPTSQILLKRYLREYNQQYDATIIVSSHDLNHITDICHRIALIEKGYVIRDLENTGHALTELEAYFSA